MCHGLRCDPERDSTSFQHTHTKLTCFISFLYKSEFTLYNYSSQNKICSAAHNMSNEL